MLWQMSFDQFLISLVGLSAVCYISGWIADGIMGAKGFGQIGNWLLLLAGTYVGMYSYNLYGYQLNWYPTMSLAVATGSASLTLVVLAAVKRAVDG